MAKMMMPDEAKPSHRPMDLDDPHRDANPMSDATDLPRASAVTAPQEVETAEIEEERAENIIMAASQEKTSRTVERHQQVRSAQVIWAASLKMTPRTVH